MAENNNDRVSLKIEKEKTRRLVISLTFILAGGGLMALFLTGKGKLVTKLPGGGEFTLELDTPITEQVNQPKQKVKTPIGDVEVTSARIKANLADKINNFDQISPTQFSGKNYIDRNNRFLLTVNDPSAWKVNYNPSGLANPMIPLTQLVFKNDMGTNVNINIETLPYPTTVYEYVEYVLEILMQGGLLLEEPKVYYDEAGQMAFLNYHNPITNGHTYQKVVMSGQRVFAVTANYNQDFSDQSAIQDAVNMVATFSLF